MSEQNKKYFKLAGFVLAIIFIVTITYFIGKPMVKFASDPELFRRWVSEKGLIGILAFVGMVIFQVLVAVIPGGPFEVCAGYAFGVWKGALLCDFATMIGSVIVFLFVRRFGMEFVELFVSREKMESVHFLKSSKKSESIIFLLFLIPGTPKDVLSYLVGMTDMKLSHWIFITFVGRFPAVFLSALGGGAVGTRRYDIALAATIVVILLYIIGLFVYRYHNRD